MWRRIALALAIATIAFAVWRAELFTVARPGDVPRPLALRGPGRPVAVDVLLPQVPAGVLRVHTEGGRALLVHYWAPWERHATLQASTIDSLRRHAPWSKIDVVLVCFDPFPSVARYVARQRLSVPVVLDHRRDLTRTLPCPSVPFTYAFDRTGAMRV